MDEKQFFEEVKKRTTWDFYDNNSERSFGFIMGRTTPFTDSRGFQSANKFPGFSIWKKEGTITLEAQIIAGSQEENLDQVCKFLQKKAVKSPTGEIYLVGEFDTIPFG